METYNEHVFLAREDEEVHVTTRKRRLANPNLPPYVMYGDRRMVRGLMKGYNLTDVLLDMSKGEQWLFRLIKANLDYRTNQAIIRSSELSRAELNKLSTAYKLLNQKDLIKRVKKEHYIVNPDAIIYPDRYDEIKKTWDAL